MSLKSIYYSINHIYQNKNVNTLYAIFKYLKWQIIKKLNLFPVKILVSKTIIEIKNKEISLEGGTKIYTQGMYDYNNMSLVQQVLSNRYNTFVDIGTNIGLYSLIASEIETAKIFSFEPHPYTYNLFIDQIKLNHRKNITALNKALSDFNGHVKFTNVNGSSVNKIVLNNSENNLISVESCKASNFIKEFNANPEIVKIDVEGFELEVLKGFENDINRVKIFLIEISKNEKEVHSLLIQNNFIGPYCYNAKKRMFLNHIKEITIEDPIYINKTYLEELVSKLKINSIEK